MKKNFARFYSIGLIMLLLLPQLIISPVEALSPSQTTVFQEGIVAFDTNVATCGAVTFASGGSTVPPSQAAIDNAKTIIGIAKTENLGQAGALIGLMVGLDESSLLNLANAKVPVSESNPSKQGDGSNYDSVGVFQQRVASGWSTLAKAAPQNIEGSEALSQQYANGYPDAVNQIMTPAYAAEAFFGSPSGANAPSALSKGLQNVSGWQSMNPWQAAQAVQRSGDSTGLNYKSHLSQAQSLLNQYWSGSAAVQLPIPLSGGSSPTASSSGSGACSATTDSAATQAVIQAGIDEVAKNIPYVYGAGGPNGPTGSPAGFDCSSFMQYVLYQGAHILLPRTAGDQYNATVGKGYSVQLKDIKPGDMLFFGSSPGNIGHVAMYIGNNQIMEAPHTGENLHIIPMYTQAAPGEPLQGIGYYPPVGG